MRLKKILLFSFFVALSLSFGCSARKVKPPAKPGKPLVLVSISPYAEFVRAIAGNTVAIKIMIPEGYNPHFYEGSPQNLVGVEKAGLFIGLGEPFEKQILKTLQEKNPNLIYVDLTKSVPLLTYQQTSQYIENNTDHNHKGHNHMDLDQVDRHIWMSPLLAKTQADVICQFLMRLVTGQEKIYQKNLFDFKARLDNLDAFCKSLLQPLTQRAILITHPSLGYFCHDYHLTQLSIEIEGKSPLPKNLQELIKKIESYHIRCIFTQPQFDDKAAFLLADKKGLAVYEINPYSQHYFDNIGSIAKMIAECNR